MLANARLRDLAEGYPPDDYGQEMARELLALREADCKTCWFRNAAEQFVGNHCSKFEDYMPASPFACKHYKEHM